MSQNNQKMPSWEERQKTEQEYQQTVLKTAKANYWLNVCQLYYSTLNSGHLLVYLTKVRQAFANTKYNQVFNGKLPPLEIPGKFTNEYKSLVSFFQGEEIIAWLDTLPEIEANSWVRTFAAEMELIINLRLAEIKQVKPTLPQFEPNINTKKTLDKKLN